MRREALEAAVHAARAPRRRRFVMVGALALAGLFTGGAGQSAAQYGPYPPSGPTTSPAQEPAKKTVAIKGASFDTYRFSPRTLGVKRGKRVRWTWISNAPHNVTFRKLHKHSKTARRGGYRLRFASRGTYRYVCTVHGFTGKIVVK